MKVDAIPIVAEGPNGERFEGHECSECGQEFFDVISDETPPRIIERAVENFIQHADEKHHSDGGVIGGSRRQNGRMCA